MHLRQLLQLVVGERRAEVEADDLAQVLEVLDVERAIEAREVEHAKDDAALDRRNLL